METTQAVYAGPKVIEVAAPPQVLALWKLPRLVVEGLYAEAYRKNDRQALRFFAYWDRYFVLTCLLRRADARNDWLFARCREVEAAPDDYIDLWAREHYKSTIITFAGSIQEIIKDPEITIGIFSNDRPTAKKFLTQIKQELEDNKQLPWLFPEIFWDEPAKQAQRWSLDGGLVMKRTSNPKEATVEAWGIIDGSPVGAHFKLRIYDDLITEEHVTNPEMIQKTTERYDLSENLGTHNGRKWIAGTRYHFGDTYGVLMRRKHYKERRYPATHDGTFDGIPVFMSERDWDRRKEGIRSIVAAQMLLNPLEGATTTFNLAWLQFWEVRPRRLNVYIICDPSKGRSAKSDFTAIVVLGMDVHRNRYLLDGYRHRMPLSERWRIIRDLHKRWSKMPFIAGVYVGYEQFGMQTDLETIEESQKREEYYFPITELSWPREGPRSKEQRIERLEPHFRSGRLRLPKTMTIDVATATATAYDCRTTQQGKDAIAHGEPWRVAQPIRKRDGDGKAYDPLDGFLEEYLFFPAAPNDDFLDALSRSEDMDMQPPASSVGEIGGGKGGIDTEPEHFHDS